MKNVGLENKTKSTKISCKFNFLSHKVTNGWINIKMHVIEYVYPSS
jgi:hypothetical protein